MTALLIALVVLVPLASFGGGYYAALRHYRALVGRRAVEIVQGAPESNFLVEHQRICKQRNALQEEVATLHGRIGDLEGRLR